MIVSFKLFPISSTVITKNFKIKKLNYDKYGKGKGNFVQQKIKLQHEPHFIYSISLTAISEFAFIYSRLIAKRTKKQIQLYGSCTTKKI